MNVFMLQCWEETQAISGNLNEVIRVFQDEATAKSVVMMLFSERFLNLKNDDNITILELDLDLYDNPTASISYERNSIMGPPETFTYWIRVQPRPME